MGSGSASRLRFACAVGMQLESRRSIFALVGRRALEHAILVLAARDSGSQQCMLLLGLCRCAWWTCSGRSSCCACWCCWCCTGAGGLCSGACSYKSRSCTSCVGSPSPSHSYRASMPPARTSRCARTRIAHLPLPLPPPPPRPRLSWDAPTQCSGSSPSRLGPFGPVNCLSSGGGSAAGALHRHRCCWPFEVHCRTHWIMGVRDPHYVYVLPFNMKR